VGGFSYRSSSGGGKFQLQKQFRLWEVSVIEKAPVMGSFSYRESSGNGKFL